MFRASSPTNVRQSTQLTRKTISQHTHTQSNFGATGAKHRTTDIKALRTRKCPDTSDPPESGSSLPGFRELTARLPDASGRTPAARSAGAHAAAAGWSRAARRGAAWAEAAAADAAAEKY
eukprot:767019-Hanusia_phi.AAC.4